MQLQNKPKSRENNIVLQKLDDELLVYDLDINKAYCLNDMAAAIWDLCDGKNSVSDISQQLSKKIKTPITDEMVYLALDQFKEDKLLLNGSDVEIKFNGLSRREIIRKVGLTSLAALPFVTSLIAPKAIAAASACIPVTGGCLCNCNGADCPAAGVDCAANGYTVVTPCADTNCVCRSLGAVGNDNCLP